ncbi:hypothetical protein GCM10022232_40080 [Streptomyces plumbiresistens]|uniref:Uncharacterized protein n=1 Tax=Streptomyces plumbiresistens TaxID=511811 RepID=A0ABP7RK51_9ACTN
MIPRLAALTVVLGTPEMAAADSPTSAIADRERYGPSRINSPTSLVSYRKQQADAVKNLPMPPAASGVRARRAPPVGTGQVR